ncbi:hypothetical protein ALC57_08605 [Trachymyrmex cornetzi]|uniref:Uncharacterized protein n=1 Tax=Trachymyrmex cornetzi TaxID=471704 RepID=A0A151J6W8_9HYME|nr:hypothetical protein ALC57_08605 [Trachymyrmex cornetzi]
MRVDMREGLKRIRKEIRKVAEGLKKLIRKEVERIKEEMKERDERWMREKEEMKERIRVLERKEKKIMVKGVKIEEGKIEEQIKEVMRSIDVGVGIERMRKMEEGRKEKRRMVVVTLGSVEDKGRIMRNKWRMKGRDIWIEDLTWKERKMRWRMRQVVMKEGGRARMGQGGGYGLKGDSGNGMKRLKS